MCLFRRQFSRLADRPVTESLKSLTDRANQLKAQGRLDDAVAVYRQATETYPSSAVAEHNLAGALGDAGRARDAETHIRKAMQKGLDAPESWLVLARALQAQFRHDEAREAFQAVLARNPLLLDAQFEWAQLIWMQSGDADVALTRIDAAVAANPQAPGLRFIRARILEFTRGPAAAYACFADALKQWPNDLGLLIPAVNVATQSGQTDLALTHAAHARSLAPNDRAPVEAQAYACLAAGRAAEAATLADMLHRSAPDDQHAIALQSTAWRMLGDDRHRALYDYSSMVKVHRLDTPAGWASLEAYVADLAAALKSVHPYQTHPFGQSVRQGSQLADVLQVDLPPIRAFSEALRGPVERHLAEIGTGGDPLRRRNTGRWRLDGIWSVWLKPGGFHADHVHPRGWLSSACYIELPAAVGAEGKQGWIKFGEPGIATDPELGFEHAVRPQPGTIVLFPSYMWHGTIPFSGEDPRLTIALDIVPA